MALDDPRPRFADRTVRPAVVLFAVVIAVSFLGFAVGTAPGDLGGAPIRAVDSSPEGMVLDAVPTARSYRGMRTRPPVASTPWEGDLRLLTSATPALTDPVALEGTSKAEVLADRAARRAYDGAPPTIPHAFRQDSALECLACHEDGVRIGSRRAPAMSHTPYASCTQCHVSGASPLQGAPVLDGGPPLAGHGFVGRPSPVEGPRAWSGAPPQIPHRTFMRERCLSCHGPGGRDAIRSSHPHRQSCEQCHAASALIDQRPGLVP